MHLRALFRALPLLTALLPLTTAQIPPSWSTNFTPSTLKLEATYSTNIRLTSGSRGGSLFPSEASSPPRFRLSDDSQLAPGARYTILLLDPDSPAPAGTGDSAYLHFLGTDYSLHSGADDARQLLPEGKPRVEYQGPKMADGGHRYVALLYVQRDGAEPEVGEVAREGFSLEGFERESGIGEAVAGLYFQTAKSDGEGRRRRDEVDDRVAGVGGAPVRRRDRRRRATVEGRDGAWEKEVAGLGPRGEKRGVIGDVNEAWRKRVTRLGPGANIKRDKLFEELDEAWKGTVAGLGPRNEKRASGLLERMKEIVKNTRPHLGPRNEKRDELFEELDEAWKKTAAGLGPRNEKRASGLLERMKEIVKNTRQRLGPRNEERDELFEELDEAWEKTIAGLGPRNEKRANGLHEKLKELAKKLGQRPGPRTQKRDELIEELDEAWKNTAAGLGPRNEKRDKGLLQRLKESIMNKGPRRQKRDRPRQKPRKTAGRGPRNAARNGTAVSWTRGGGRRSRRPGRGA